MMSIKFLQNPRFNTVSKVAVTALFSVLFLFGCALSPPVQEMSNARQTIKAAKDASAAKYAPDYLREAESLMEAATRALDDGDYLNARDLAVAAQQQAIQARQKSLIRLKKD